MTEELMRTYSSFLVRCWLTQDSSQGEHSVLQIEHIQTGASVKAASLTEVEPWILEACRAINHPARPYEDISRLRDKGVKVFALAEDLEERGISEGNSLGGVQIIRSGEVAALMKDYEQVWHW